MGKARAGSAGGAFGAAFRPVDLRPVFQWPPKRLRGDWWRELADHVRAYPQGRQRSWGIPFRMAGGEGPRVALVTAGRAAVRIALRGRARFLCVLHEWRQMPEEVHWQEPREGLVVGEYEAAYADGTTAVIPVRARFEVAMVESPGPPWLALPFGMPSSVDPTRYPPEVDWGRAQTGVRFGIGFPLVCALENPWPDKALRALTVRGLTRSPLILAGLTLYRGGSHPLRHLPRRTYRVKTAHGPARVAEAQVDLGGVTRLEQTQGARGARWLRSPSVGLSRATEETAGGETLVEAFGSEDATLSVRLRGRPGRLRFSLGEAFHRGEADEATGKAKLQVLGRERQWMQVTIKDARTGEPVPARVHLSGPRGNYIAPYGHHAEINAGWFMDYGADVVAGGKNFAYVPGEFTTDLPVGDVYVELCKGFEYRPVRRKLTVRRGQKRLELKLERALDWRAQGWVTADTHVHFISPHTAALQAQGEGVNLVNLLASQWGRLFTNVGDIRGAPNVLEKDTIVYVGTENRNHMLGHMSARARPGSGTPISSPSPNGRWRTGAGAAWSSGPITPTAATPRTPWRSSRGWSMRWRSTPRATAVSPSRSGIAT